MVISKNTVLVLGAGASEPYALLTGGELKNRIISQVADTSMPIGRAVVEAGFLSDSVTTFRDKLRMAPLSIDRFLQTQPSFLELGKFAIAAALLPCEDESRFLNPLSSGDWYSYLLGNLLPPAFDDLRSNKLSVITFNFDRSFERRLYLAIRDTYDADEDVWRRLAQTFPIVHVHGMLGRPRWLETSDTGHAPPAALNYGEIVTVTQLKECATQIHLVHQSGDTGELKRAKLLIEPADIVAFIGFSFDPDNLAKIGCPALLHNKIVYGTCRGFEEEEAKRAAVPFANAGAARVEGFKSWTALEFLRKSTFLSAVGS
jgi:hypothetical protein